jgi:hypothetical protein
MKVSFSDFVYFPALRTREAEMRALRQLTEGDKKHILPLVTLGKWRNDEEDLSSSLKALGLAMGDRPVILDITNESAHHSEVTRSFKNPNKYFEAWQAFLRQKLFNVVPVVQFAASATQRDITQQALRLERAHKCIAFRVRDFFTDLPKVTSAMSALDDTENALVVFDAGYIRYVNTNTITQGLIQGVIQAVNELRDAIPESYVCLISTSFPRSVTPFCAKEGTSGEIEILEHRLYLSTSGLESDIFYGDHGSVHSVVYADSGGRYIPRIDLTKSEAWTFERRPGAGPKGYSEAAAALVKTHPEIRAEADDCWGFRQILAASEGNLENLQTPSRWIGVRVNIHLRRQIQWLSEEIAPEPDLETDET